MTVTMTVDIKEETNSTGVYYNVQIRDEYGLIMDTVLSYQGVEDLRYSLTQAWNRALGLGPRACQPVLTPNPKAQSPNT